MLPNKWLAGWLQPPRSLSLPSVRPSADAELLLNNLLKSPQQRRRPSWFLPLLCSALLCSRVPYDMAAPPVVTASQSRSGYSET